MSLRWMRAFLLVLLTCAAASSWAVEAFSGSDALLQAQLEAAHASLAAERPPRLVFAGFAMHSGSSAFRGDVELAAEVMREIDPRAVMFELANPPAGREADWPLATRGNIRTVLQAIARDVRPSDKVVLLFTTHGSARLLGVQEAQGRPDAIEASELQDWLAPLRSRPVLVLVSACYSGSFVPALMAPSHIVLTAASSTRSSFGCKSDSRNTFFVEELLRQDDLLSHSLVEIVDRARTAIERRESAMRLLASQPQSYWGSDAQAWARQPLASWLGTKQQ